MSFENQFFKQKFEQEGKKEKGILNFLREKNIRNITAAFSLLTALAIADGKFNKAEASDDKTDSKKTEEFFDLSGSSSGFEGNKFIVNPGDIKSNIETAPIDSVSIENNKDKKDGDNVRTEKLFGDTENVQRKSIGEIK